jgi:hypothetical protein
VAASAGRGGDRWGENLDSRLEGDHDCLSAWARDSPKVKAAMERPVVLGLRASLQHQVRRRQGEQQKVA